MIKNIIFDWSGTLSDDLIPVYTATMRVFKKLGLKILTLEEFKEEFILPYMKFYHKFKKDVTKDEVDKLYLPEINSVGEPKLFPRAKDILEFLKNKGVKAALLSTHPEEKLNKEIRNYGLQQLFIDVNGSIYDKVEAILEIMKKNEFKSIETAYVGDMVHDIKAGKRAKTITVAVSWGYQSKEKLLAEGPDFFIEDLDKLKNII